MKKILLSCAAAVALFVMASCGSSPKQQFIDLCNETAEQMEAANGDPEKLEKISENFSKEAEEIEKGMSEKEKEEFEDDPEVTKAAGKVIGAAFGAAASSLGK